MNTALLWRSVLLRLGRYKVKTLVMGLGMMVGVVSTVLLQTVAASLRAAFEVFIDRAYPADGVFLMAGTGSMGGGAGRDRLRLSDVEAVANSIGVAQWDPAVYARGRDVKRGGNSLRVSVAGHSEKAETVRGRSAEEGEFFTADDVRNRGKVALLGTTTAARLFPGESPIGAHLFIDNISFQIKGVLERAGVDPHGGDQDNTIWVPYTTLMDTVLKRDTVAAATFIVGERSRQESVRQEIVEILRERHQLGSGQEDDFSVVTPVFMQDLLDRSFRTFTVFVPIIAGTVFLISGIVILSIMQISIKGRTKEIGLRKAVGARPRDLQTQIMLEVLIVAVGAALIGLVLARLGYMGLAPVLAAKFGAKEASPPLNALIGAIGGAIATGLLGGVVPARRAARLNPVEALR